MAISSGTLVRPPERTSSSSLRAIEPESAASPFATPREEVDQPAGRLGLEQVAGRAAADRGEEVLLGPGGGEHDDLALRSGLADSGEGGEAVHSGHGEVEQHEVGRELRCLLERLRAVGRLADDGEPVLGEQRAERLPGERVVVDEEDADGHGVLIGRGGRADEGEHAACRARIRTRTGCSA